MSETLQGRGSRKRGIREREKEKEEARGEREVEDLRAVWRQPGARCCWGCGGGVFGRSTIANSINPDGWAKVIQAERYVQRFTNAQMLCEEACVMSGRRAKHCRSQPIRRSLHIMVY